MRQIFNQLFFFWAMMICTIFVQAQVPQGFSYQAVARDAAGICIQNSTISLRIGIRDTAANGPVIYLERHDNIATNAQGLFSLTIGAGVPQGTPDFTTLDWSNGRKWLEVEMDTMGASNFVLVGTQQLMSVPYAMYAERTYIPHAFDDARTVTESTLRNQWLTDAGIEVTVPETGTYLIIGTGRAWRMRNTQNEWAKFRIYNVTVGADLGNGFIGHVEAGSGDAGNGDQTGSNTVIAPLQKGDILRLEFYIRSSVNTSSANAAYGGDSNGYSSLSIMKVGL